jgi:DNA transformation protein and related proteins
MEISLPCSGKLSVLTCVERAARLDPDFIAELFAQFRPVTVRRLFGGAGIYAEGLMFALVFDGAVYLKVDAASIPDFEREGCKPFVYTRAKSPGRVGRRSLSYWRMPERLYDDPDQLAVWAGRALSDRAIQEDRPAGAGQEAGIEKGGATEVACEPVTQQQPTRHPFAPLPVDPRRAQARSLPPCRMLESRCIYRCVPRLRGSQRNRIASLERTLSPLLCRSHDGMDRPSGKAKRHQHLRRTRQAVLYQTLCRPTFGAQAGERCRVPALVRRLPPVAAYYANLRDCALSSESEVECGQRPTRLELVISASEGRRMGGMRTAPLHGWKLRMHEIAPCGSAVQPQAYEYHCCVWLVGLQVP